ncbi:cytochrome P450 [Pseudoalteromonas rubra]|uniref:cytochrome P450 n=1 Tax=Pseudoalteromonas rubra TaxID=43658 RepID=UPI000F76D1B9|nr:cytochrome P450 [Pseudoalteromonas rubra]
MRLEDTDDKFDKPFQALDQALSHCPAHIEFEQDNYYVTDFDSAKQAMGNPDGNYVEQSDFFNVDGAMFSTRDAQIAIGKDAILSLKRYYEQRRSQIIETFRDQVGQGLSWPDSANDLMYCTFYDFLVDSQRSPQLHKHLDKVLRHSLYSGQKTHGSGWRRAFIRLRVHRALRAVFKARRQQPPYQGTNRDVIDILLACSPDNESPKALAQIFLSFFFAINSSMAFTLAWSLYFCAKEGGVLHPAPWIVKEALRLWPVAWNLPRTPSKAHTLGELNIKQSDTVTVCPYVLHRHPDNWSQPERFYPPRWENATADAPYMPFGWGTHKCIASAFVLNFTSDLISALQGQQLIFEQLSEELHPEPAIAPPEFRVKVKTSA